MYHLRYVKYDISKALAVHKIAKYGHLHLLFHGTHNHDLIHLYSWHGLSGGS